MLIYIALFASVTSLFRQRGWFSPLLGLGAVLLMVALAAFIMSMSNIDVLAHWEYYSGMELLIAFYVAGAAYAVFYVCASLLPVVDMRTISKSSRFPYRATGIVLSVIIAISVVFIALSLLGGIVAGDQFLESDADWHMWTRFLLLLLYINIMLVVAAVSCFRLSQQQRQAANRWKLLLGNQYPILYLRSFEFEKESVRNRRNRSFLSQLRRTPGARFDNVLGKAFRRLGVFIALGNPGDYLPTPGAHKIYPSDDAWQDYVRRLSDVSRAVLLVEGATPGLLWELEHIKAHVEPKRLFILTATKEYRKAYRKGTKEPLWEGFIKLLNQAGLPDLGGDPGPGAVIAFNDDWKPMAIAYGVKSARAYRSIFQEFLPRTEGEFDFRQLSDLLFTGIVEREERSSPLNWRLITGVLVAGTTSAMLSVVIALLGINILLGGEIQAAQERLAERQRAQDEGHAAIAAVRPQTFRHEYSDAPFTLRLSEGWRRLPARGNAAMLFDHGAETAFSAVAVGREFLVPGLDEQGWLESVLEEMAMGSEQPVHVLRHERRTYGGREWEYAQIEWVENGILIVGTRVFFIGDDGAFMLSGWTSDPETGNPVIDAALQGFAFGL